MIARFLLDEHGEAPAPPGYRVVSDHLGFLAEALGQGSLMLRGGHLCAWARELCQARGWTLEYATTPTQEVRLACPDLTEDHAKSLVARLGDRFSTMERPLSSFSISEEMWPAEMWRVVSDEQHAASWLIWRQGVDLDQPEQKLVENVARSWLAASQPAQWSRAYTAVVPTEAWGLLKEWLNVAACTVPWVPFPVRPIPRAVQKRLQSEWNETALLTKGRFFLDLQCHPVPQELLRLAAEAVGSYLEANGSEATAELARAIQPYLTSSDFSRIRKLMPPADPGPPPQDTQGVLTWFLESYLPYRQWQVTYGSDEARTRVETLARMFGTWYLRKYAEARTGAKEAAFLSWTKAARLRDENRDYACLMVVLDGLGYTDAADFIRLLAVETDDLPVDRMDIAFSSLPTVTSFAKPALMAGVMPAQAIEEGALGSVERSEGSIAAQLRVGQAVIWSLLEPDRAYHWSGTPEAALEEVPTKLQSIARRLAKLAKVVPEKMRLRIVVTTDHGRLMACAPRSVDPPAGMQAHGRAAWGSSDRAFPAEGFVIEDDVAYLHPGRFGLAESCAVILSDQAFKAIGGKQGMEVFPHGGVYPEEVLVPWVQFTRRHEAVGLAVAATGTGVAGARGTLRVSIHNPSDTEVRLVQLSFSLGWSFTMTESLPPMKTVSFEKPVEPWPGDEDARAATGVLSYTLLSGAARTLEFRPDLETETLYRSDDILGDLRG